MEFWRAYLPITQSTRALISGADLPGKLNTDALARKRRPCPTELLRLRNDHPVSRRQEGSQRFCRPQACLIRRESRILGDSFACTHHQQASGAAFGQFYPTASTARGKKTPMVV